MSTANLPVGVKSLKKPNVAWDDVVGHEGAKDVLHGTLVFPAKYPHLFSNERRQPWNPILLYGPPGNGKTYLAEAAATELKGNLLRVNGYDLSTKVTEASEIEGAIKAIFDTVPANQPTVILIEELDFLSNMRTKIFFERELHRHVSALAERPSAAAHILVLGETSAPWRLEGLLLQIFPKRLCINLPDEDARANMFRRGVGSSPCDLQEDDYRSLGARTEGCSGKAVNNAIQEAFMQPINRIRRATHYKKISTGVSKRYTPCSPEEPGAIEMSWKSIKGDKLVEPPVLLEDFLMAVDRFCVNCPHYEQAQLYDNWTKSYGQEGA